MDLGTVKICFQKYMSYLEKYEKITYQEPYDLENITIQEMDKIVQITFMDYTIKCDDKVNQFSVPCTLYKHINTIIRQYIQDNSDKVKTQLKEYIFKLEDENNKLKSHTEKTSVTQKGWFY